MATGRSIQLHPHPAFLFKTSGEPVSWKLTGAANGDGKKPIVYNNLDPVILHWCPALKKSVQVKRAERLRRVNSSYKSREEWQAMNYSF